ncbi:MAG: hypothetical protein U0Z53_29090 [Blastocatellia bacterium]
MKLRLITGQNIREARLLTERGEEIEGVGRYELRLEGGRVSLIAAFEEIEIVCATDENFPLVVERERSRAMAARLARHIQPIPESAS